MAQIRMKATAGKPASADRRGLNLCNLCNLRITSFLYASAISAFSAVMFSCLQIINHPFQIIHSKNLTTYRGSGGHGICGVGSSPCAVDPLGAGANRLKVSPFQNPRQFAARGLVGEQPVSPDPFNQRKLRQADIRHREVVVPPAPGSHFQVPGDQDAIQNTSRLYPWMKRHVCARGSG
jgi:hypothetical protein